MSPSASLIVLAALLAVFLPCIYIGFLVWYKAKHKTRDALRDVEGGMVMVRDPRVERKPARAEAASEKEDRWWGFVDISLDAVYHEAASLAVGPGPQDASSRKADRAPHATATNSSTREA